MNKEKYTAYLIFIVIFFLKGQLLLNIFEIVFPDWDFHNSKQIIFNDYNEDITLKYFSVVSLNSNAIYEYLKFNNLNYKTAKNRIFPIYLKSNKLTSFSDDSYCFRIFKFKNKYYYFKKNPKSNKLSESFSNEYLDTDRINSTKYLYSLFLLFDFVILLLLILLSNKYVYLRLNFLYWFSIVIWTIVIISNMLNMFFVIKYI